MRHWGLTADRAANGSYGAARLSDGAGFLTYLRALPTGTSSMRPRRGAPALVPTLQPPGCVSPLHSARFRAASPTQLCQRFVPLPEAMVSRSWRSHALGETASPRCLSSLATRLLDRQRYDGILDLLRHAVLQHRLLAADFLQGSFAALVVELLEPVEAVAAVIHHLAGLADIAELLGELQQANLGADDLLFSRHGVLQCADAGRFATPTALRPCSARDSPWGKDTSVILSFA
jgi:hypothetical protein